MGTTKDFIEQQGDWNEKHRMLDSEYIQCEHTSAGIRPHLQGIQQAVASAAASATGTSIPAIITGKSASLYDVDLYANGYAASSTGTGQMEVLDLNLGDTLDTGAKILAFTQITEILDTGDA